MLATLHPFTRLGLAILILTLLGGYFVSGVYLHQHYENRDERPGLTITDIRGAYAGVVVPSPLLESLRAGHPGEIEGATLADADRVALIDWLESQEPNRIRADYENFDLGDAMPADIIAIGCTSCHARAATIANAASSLPLEYPDDVFALALSRTINPKDPAIIVQSLHAHAPTMAVITIVMALLAAMTRFPRALVGVVITITAAALLTDLGAQYLAGAHHPAWTYAIIFGGFGATGGLTLLALLTLVDLARPVGKTMKSE